MLMAIRMNTPMFMVTDMITGMTTAMTTAGNIITAPMTTSISMHTRRRITTAAIIITEQGLPASLLPA